MRVPLQPPTRRHAVPGWVLIWLVLGVVTPLLPAPARSGPHRDGRFVLHVVPEFAATRDGEDRDLRSCEGAVTSLPGDESMVAIFLLTAFPDWVVPDLTGVVFGISYTTVVLDAGRGLDFADLNRSFELPTNDWPGSGSGNAITVVEPIDERLSTVYWFLTYAYQGSTFEVVEHPVQGGPAFSDSSIPSLLDEARRDDLGRIGFGVPGYNPCLADIPTGACCYETGVCTITAEVACEDEDGAYIGDDTACDPFACVGACCYEGDCTQELPQECERIGGWFRGVGRSCTNTTCLSENVTWGTLKRAYRQEF